MIKIWIKFNQLGKAKNILKIKNRFLVAWLINIANLLKLLQYLLGGKEIVKINIDVKSLF
ncbi:hypothetical protein CKF54_04280 [Psittacicella hinzii]|uniref:Uncharacterized protein n=1 Tax=Psittacicella hinzii TaxID=2028575 RepID=A0A3A1Y5Z4_9GAMM|nr:hypothetical protein CKF54_04280 [Psittacicella hinzii]